MRDGCEVAPHCLECPLPQCKHERGAPARPPVARAALDASDDEILEAQWARLYARGVVPREVAVAVSYTYGVVPESCAVAEEIRALAIAAGMRIETLPEFRKRMRDFRRQQSLRDGGTRTPARRAA